MAAPSLLTCLDAEDIRPCIGEPLRAAELVLAVWSTRRNVLCFAQACELEALRSSRRVAAFIYKSQESRAPVGSLLQLLREAATAAESIVYQLAVGYVKRSGDTVDDVQVTLVQWVG